MEHHEQDRAQVFPKVRDLAARMVLDNVVQDGTRRLSFTPIAAKKVCLASTLVRQGKAGVSQ